MKFKVAIIDYGMGNLYSVRNAFSSLGVKADIVGEADKITRFDKLILPGVGAFGDAVSELKRRGFIDGIRDFVSQGRPFLGICLGLHLLFEKSEESKGVAGLKIIPGAVRRFSSRLKCPHIGWNEVEKCRARGALFGGIRGELYTYFCHSYFVKPQDDSVVIGETRYGVKFASVIQKDNVYGMQFHPEKSQDKGLKLLENFVERC